MTQEERLAFLIERFKEDSGEAYCPEQIEERSIFIGGDCAEVLAGLIPDKSKQTYVSGP